MNNSYTDEEISWLIKNYSTLGVEACARHLSRTIGSIKYRARKLNITKKITIHAEVNVGDKFGMLSVVEKIIKKREGYNGIYWICECECGGAKTVYQYDLRCGKVKSCGCKYSDLCKDPLHLLHRGIKLRCYNENRSDYHRYGGRGIQMFPSWIDDPKSFIEWVRTNLGDRPDNMTLDRINNDGNYEPGNLRWADSTTQKLNSRSTNLTREDINNIRQEYENGDIFQKDLAKKYNMSHTQVWRIVNYTSWKEV